MKKLLILLAIVTFAAATSMSAFAGDIVIYEASAGKVTFDHKGHGEKLGCDACHQGAPAKIVIDKKYAHKDGCMNCHKAKGGPSKCNKCHIK